jgi:hypothetical protein
MADDRLTFKVVHTTKNHKSSVPVTQISHATSGFKAFAYQCSLEEDLDGAPEAYGKNNPTVDPRNPSTMLQRGLNPKDHLGNATSPWQNFGKPGNHWAWVGLIATTAANARAHGLSIDQRPELEARMTIDTNGNPVPLPAGAPGLFPVIQPAVVPGMDHASPAPGYFVSTSAAVTDRSLPAWDQTRYVDALTIPYAAWATWWHAFGVEKGDFGLAIRRATGACSGFVFGDSGSGKVGEVSRRLFETLTPERNNEDPFLFLVFSGSGATVSNKIKFNNQQVIEAQVLRNVTRLNNIPSNEDIIEFLRDASNPGLAQTLIKANTPDRRWPYATIKAALRIYGFWPSSTGAEPGVGQQTVPGHPAARPPLIF